MTSTLFYALMIVCCFFLIWNRWGLHKIKCWINFWSRRTLGSQFLIFRYRITNGQSTGMKTSDHWISTRSMGNSVFTLKWVGLLNRRRNKKIKKKINKQTQRSSEFFPFEHYNFFLYKRKNQQTNKAMSMSEIEAPAIQLKTQI